MTIEFRPPGLEGQIKSRFAKNRVGNRTGFAKCGDIIIADGNMLEVYQAAKEYQESNSTAVILVVENSCGTSGETTHSLIR